MRIAVAAVLLTGCTLVSDLDGQACETDLDCGEGRACSANNLCLLIAEERACVRTDQCEAGEVCALGSCEEEETARWGCATTSQDATSDSEEVTLRLQVMTRVDGKSAEVVPPATQVMGAVCELPGCDGSETAVAASEAGLLEVKVAPGFQGLIKLSSAGLLDTFYQLQAPLSSTASTPVQVLMLSESELSALALAADADLNLTERGVVVFQISDCLGEPSGGISVANLADDAEGDLVYLAEDQSVDTAASSTSDTGVAIALDAAVGSMPYKLTRTEASMDLGSMTVATVAGSVTYFPYQFGR